MIVIDRVNIKFEVLKGKAKKFLIEPNHLFLPIFLIIYLIKFYFFHL